MNDSNRKFCQECQMEYDWKPTVASGQEFCCQACAQGRQCTCGSHNHNTERASASNQGKMTERA